MLGPPRQTSYFHSSFWVLGVWVLRAGLPQGLLPGAPTDPDVHIKCIRFVTLWNSLSLTRLGRFAVTR